MDTNPFESFEFKAGINAKTEKIANLLMNCKVNSIVTYNDMLKAVGEKDINLIRHNILKAKRYAENKGFNFKTLRSEGYIRLSSDDAIDKAYEDSRNKIHNVIKNTTRKLRRINIDELSDEKVKTMNLLYYQSVILTEINDPKNQQKLLESEQIKQEPLKLQAALKILSSKNEE